MNKTRLIAVIVITAITWGLAVLLSGCAFRSKESTGVENQVVPVERGDITIDISAAGNLSYSLKKDLAFDMAGTVEEVLVEVGDSVEEGQVLAKLDTSEWEEQLAAKELDLTQAEVNLKNAQVALDKAENPWKNYTEEEREDAEEAVEDAQEEVDLAKRRLRDAIKSGDVLEGQRCQLDLYNAQVKLDIAQDKLDEMVYELDEDDVEIKGMLVQIAEGRLENAKKAVEKALAASPEITAPFDGFITQVNVEGGDEVTKGTVAMQVADPTRFEAELLVSETNIFKVKLGGEARVQLDVMPTFNLPASVTYISPTATIQSGVVNYEVTVEVESLETIRQQQETMQSPQGVAPEPMPTLIPEDFQLKEGLTVTVSIVVEEKNDVLLVPNRAITYRGTEAYVLVVSPDGTIEPRLIQTGISDSQNTEVTSGLSEGEQVVIPQTTTTTPTTSQPTGPGFMFFEGGGPPPPPEERD